LLEYAMRSLRIINGNKLWDFFWRYTFEFVSKDILQSAYGSTNMGKSLQIS
jgi:hypothetical protein